MDDNKIVELNIKKQEEPLTQKAPSLHTNPIMKRMLSYSFDDKKQKFTLKDLFR